VSNGLRVIAYNPGLTAGTSLFREWPWWAKLVMAVASRLRGANTIEQAGDAIAALGLGTVVPPAGRIYASLVKGKLTWPDPSELAQSDTAMKELWVEQLACQRADSTSAQTVRSAKELLDNEKAIGELQQSSRRD
jgi:hypothetical protein